MDYGWQRFWIPRGGAIHLGEDGYLPEGDDWWRGSLNPELREFNDLVDTPALVLLGEPGSGKSFAAERAATGLRESGTEAFLYPLRAADSKETLRRELFAAPALQRWQTGEHHLHLFLDGLDEGLLQAKFLFSHLTEWFSTLDVKRIALRITCRSADWRASFERGILRFWEELGVYEIAPLRRMDVAAAVAAEGLDPEAFLAAVRSRRAEPLAIRPITLLLLIRLFSEGRSLPDSLTELYGAGCRALVDEHDDERARAAPRANDPNQLLAIAERLAAVTMFCGRESFARLAPAVPSQALVADLSFGTEAASLPDFTETGAGFEVSEAAILEALSTGLFTLRGQGNIGWAHQSYADFLAARFLIRRDVGLAAMSSLLLHADDQSQVVPQLAAVAAWLSTMDPAVCEFIATHQPELLLRTDITDEGVRAAVVDALIERAPSGIGYLPAEHLKRLAHSGLSDQIRPLLADPAEDWVKRSFAVDVAEAVGAADVAAEVAEIAVAPLEDLRLRINAAFAVGRIGDVAARQKLLPLVHATSEEDPDDELRGAALLAVWPDILPLDQLFQALDRPRNRNLFGAYRMFLGSKIFRSLQADDLPRAYEWARSQTKGARGDSFDSVIDELVVIGLDQTAAGSVSSQFTELVATLLTRDHGLFSQTSREAHTAALADVVTRRALLRLLLPNIASGRIDPSLLIFARPSVVTTADMPWIIEELLAADAARDESAEEAWSQLVERLFYPHNEEHALLVMETAEKSTVLAEHLSHVLRSVRVDSDEAERGREMQRNLRDMEQRDAKQELTEVELDDRLKESIAARLRAIEQGELDVWWILNIDLLADVPGDRERQINEYSSDLRQSRTWTEGGVEIRSRILSAALAYVRGRDANPDTWFGRDVFHRPAAAGYRALRLLLEEAPGELERLPADAWKRWTPIIVGFGGFSDAEVVPQSRLLGRALASAPADALKYIELRIRDEDRQHGTSYFVRRLARHPSPATDDLIRRLARSRVSALTKLALVRLLLERSPDEAGRLLRNWVSRRSRSETGHRLAVLSAVVLLDEIPGSFDFVWNSLGGDQRFGQAVVETLASGHESNEAVRLALLSETQIGTLYEWIRLHYFELAHKDAGAGDDDLVTPLDDVSRLRSRLIETLVARGTAASAVTIDQLASGESDALWLRRAALRARQRHAEQSWVPLTPVQLIEFLDRAESRIVRSGSHLLDVLQELLSEAQLRLTGETPDAPLLWNYGPTLPSRPKDETAMSDWLKNFLQDRLVVRRVVVNREVEVRSPPQGLGERTDIHVDAFTSAGAEDVVDLISAVIEVKACWNPALRHELKSQLVDRYLGATGIRHGIYAVGDYRCNRWDGEDRRRGVCQRQFGSGIIDELAREAKDLSDHHKLDVRVVTLKVPL